MRPLLPEFTLSLQKKKMFGIFYVSVHPMLLSSAYSLLFHSVVILLVRFHCHRAQSAVTPLHIQYKAASCLSLQDRQTVAPV